MLKPFKRPGSDNWWFKKRVGKDIVEQARGQTFEVVFPAHDSFPEYRAKTKFGDSVTCTLATTNRQLAQDRCHLANIEYSKCRDRLVNKAKIRSDPAITSLAKTLFNYFNDEHLNAETPVGYDWLSVDGIRQASIELSSSEFFVMWGGKYFNGDYRYSLQPYHCEMFSADDKSLKAMESRYGVICNWALCYKKILIDESSRYQMLCDFETFLNQGRTEQHMRRLSEKRASINVTHNEGSVSFQRIFDEWVKHDDPKINSQVSWQSALKNIIKFLGHDDAAKVSSFDIERWKDSYTADSKPSIKTAQTSHFPCVRRMYTLAISKRLLSYNPTQGITISLKKVPRRRIIPYTNAEMRLILDAAHLNGDPLLKWLPILCAVTGARIGELSQIWYEQVKVDPLSGIWILDIKPAQDGGYIKNEESIREVPIHRGILTEFLKFRDTRKNLPLFYDKRHDDPAKKHPSQFLGIKIAKFYKTLEVDDPNKSPNHSIRHWFTSTALRARVPADNIKKIQGHKKPGGSSVRYEHILMEDLLRDIESIPIPTIRIPSDTELSAGSTPSP